jgi:Helix-turn-helix domain
MNQRQRIMKLSREGLSSVAIAQRLGCSPTTVSNTLRSPDYSGGPHRDYLRLFGKDAGKVRCLYCFALNGNAPALTMEEAREHRANPGIIRRSVKPGRIPDELKERARKMRAQGMRVRDILRDLAQYHPTLAESSVGNWTRDWSGLPKLPSS